jgi:hypothetical protein
MDVQTLTALEMHSGPIHRRKPIPLAGHRRLKQNKINGLAILQNPSGFQEDGAYKPVIAGSTTVLSVCFQQLRKEQHSYIYPAV